ncbi:hypothetical protein [Williamsia sterculiae]|uniref:Ketohydroxyglutarate aldolase n=1 Tax=Williamsia sterculiae TaxID=1344003 RepID=A0A1N7H3J4_9NOCA|nr:hypothetical protein [Williamsia sterculiae]SIS19389.1 hypothetical protein SAMN05445060_3472 [Williamsia sterculiae]
MPQFTLTVADHKLGEIDGVAAAAAQAGMHVDQVLGQVGIICGTAPAECAPTLRSIEGVAAVEASHSYQAAPPDSPVQ